MRPIIRTITDSSAWAGTERHENRVCTLFRRSIYVESGVPTAERRIIPAWTLWNLQLQFRPPCCWRRRMGFANL